MHSFSIERYHSGINTTEILSLIAEIQLNEFGINLTENHINSLDNIANYFNDEKNKEVNFWVALANDNIVGTVGLKRLNKKESELKRFFIKKEFRGQGISEALTRIVIAQARSINKSALYLGTGSSKARAIAFYLKNGFVEVDKIHLPKEYEIDPLDNHFFKFIL